jgi:putative membrane-bound dehydrogenase-like protein
MLHRLLQQRFGRRRFLVGLGPILLAISVSMAEAQPPERPDAVTPSLADELPRIPPHAPQAALETFAVQHGFTLELVAAEPAVADPVDACFDEHGRMYVAQMHGYPYSAEVREQQPAPLGLPDAGCVQLLSDRDGDGTFETSTRFADRISWPTSVCCYDGGLFVLAPSRLLYLKDTDGDGRADVRRVVFSGFSRANVQGLANNLKWGRDSRIYFSGGTNGGEFSDNGELRVSLRGADVAFDPRTHTVELLSGGRQFGHTFDDWGRRFVCSNSDHIQQVIFERRELERHPSVSVPQVISSIAAEGAAATVFRTSPAEPWRLVRTRRRAADPAYRQRLAPTELVPTGFFTSATGVTIYRGDAYPDAFRGNAFIGDVGGNLVHRKHLSGHGPRQVASRTEAGVEFLTSTDTWFRPVNFVNAPDGCLYILDMYRETIEHPASIPEDIKAHLDLESGRDRGRIWRLVPPQWHRRAPSDLGRTPAAELVGLLAHPNLWHRETAQRLLWERDDHTIAGQLRELLRTTDAAIGRAHGLSLLDRFGALTAEDLQRAFEDADPRVRAHAVDLLAGQWSHPEGPAPEFEALLPMLDRLAHDRMELVPFRLSLLLAAVPPSSVQQRLWVAVATAAPLSADLRTALLLAARGERVSLIRALLARDTSAEELLTSLAGLIGTAGSPTERQALLALLLSEQLRDDTRAELLQSLCEGLERSGRSLALELADPGLTPALQESVTRFFDAARESALDKGRSVQDRIAATRIATLGPGDVFGMLATLLEPQVPVDLQSRAIESLRRQTSPEVGRLLLERWNTLTPALRKTGREVLMSRTELTRQLLEALGEGRIGQGDLESSERQLLLHHPQRAVRERAAEVLESEVSADREAVIRQYAAALDAPPDLERGRATFLRICATCHRLGTEGHAVGPDLASVANKSPEDLLVALLDPNRERQPNFTSYTVVTRDGRVFSGLIAAETATTLTLRGAGAKEDTLSRGEIELLTANGVSLMPQGLERDIPPEQLADLIALIRSAPAGIQQTP